MNILAVLDAVKLSLRRAGPITLIVANSIPLAGVLFWGWDVGAIVTLYWSENLIIGIIALLKMYHLKEKAALGPMAFFTAHYGFFWLAHGAILTTLIVSHPAHATGGFISGAEGSESEAFDTLFGPASSIFSEASALWMAAFTALLISHVVSLFANYFRRQEYLATKLNDLMTAPYKRVLVLHVAVLFGGLAVEKLGSGVYLLIALVLLKTVVDLTYHNKEHARDGYAYAPTSPPPSNSPN